MSKLGLRPLLLTLVVLPCAIAAVPAFDRAWERHGSADQAAALGRMAQLAVVIGDLLHETQKERGSSSVFLSSNGAKFAEQVVAQRRLTDQVRLRFVEVIEDQRSYWPPRVVAALELANSMLRDIESRRRQISALEISPAEEMGFYTELNERLLESLGSLVANTADVSLRGTTTAYLYFLHAKEKTGLERAQLSNVFGTDKFAAGQLAFVSGLIASEAAYLNVFGKLAPPEIVAAYGKLLAAPPVAEVQRMEQVALGRPSGFGVDSAVWFRTMTKKIDLLKEIEDQLSVTIRAGAARVTEEARIALVGALALAALLFSAAVLATLAVVLSIVRPIGRLRASVDRITAGDFTVAIIPGGPREIRELGESFGGMLASLRRPRPAPAAAPVEPGGRSVGSRLTSVRR